MSQSLTHTSSTELFTPSLAINVNIEHFLLAGPQSSLATAESVIRCVVDIRSPIVVSQLG